MCGEHEKLQKSISACHFFLMILIYWIIKFDKLSNKLDDRLSGNTNSRQTREQ